MSQSDQPAGFSDPNAPSDPPYPTGPQSAPNPYANPAGEPSPYGTTDQNPYSASSASAYPNYPQQGYPQQDYPQQAPPTQAYPQQGYQQQGYQQQGFQQQAYPGQNSYLPAGQPNPYDQPMVPYAEQKSKLAAGLLGIFLGSLGIHNFYLGKTGIGLVQLLCSVLSIGILAPLVAIWSLIEGILILTGSPSYSRDSRGIPLRD